MTKKKTSTEVSKKKTVSDKEFFEALDHDFKILDDLIQSYEEEVQDLKTIERLQNGLLEDLDSKTPNAMERVYEYFCSLGLETLDNS